MNKLEFKRGLLFALLLIAATVVGSLAYSAGPPVKKSKSGICHSKSGAYYSRTKNYTPYNSMEACLMEACLKSGG